MIELWKECPGYEGRYMVSSFGRVKRQAYSIVYVNGREHFYEEEILKPQLTKQGYYRIELVSPSGKPKKEFVHRLVALAFIENPERLPFVNHKDENPQNNYVGNLEWCTPYYNTHYGTRNERIAATLSKPVKCVETGVVYKSQQEAEEALGISDLWGCLSGKYKTAGGYHWQRV